MDWLIDPRDPRPPFDQLRVQVIDDIRSGRLVAGVRMPTVRELASRLGVAVNTVARSYRELEAGGFLETRGRAGTVVRADSGSVAQAAAERTSAYLQEMAALGLTSDAAIELIRAIGSRYAAT